MKIVLTWLWAFASGLNPLFVAVASTVTTLTAGFVYINAKMVLLVAKIDLVAHQSFAGSLNIAPLGFLNTFVPVTETMTFLSAYIALLGACAVVRIIKSFVPTIAS
jgi:hypothetical protein